jgi:Holliday junction resolvase RusA-like endonuclease
MDDEKIIFEKSPGGNSNLGGWIEKNGQGMILAHFVVPGVPYAQPRGRAMVVGGRAIIRSADSRSPVNLYKASILQHAAEAYRDPPTDEAVRMWCEFVMPRVRSQVWKRRPMPTVPHTKRPDLDNLVKAVKDALSGIVWRDDCQVCGCELVKRVASGSETPRTEIHIGSVRCDAHSQQEWVGWTHAKR